jgi:hypothetical protein
MPSYPVAYNELLAYARRISKTTLPPPGVTNGVVLNGDTGSGEVTNANGTPAPGNSVAQTPVQSQIHTPTADISSQLASELPTQQTIASTNTSLPEGLSQHLNPLTGTLFFPWPQEDKIRNGALASNQLLAEQGIDPKGYDPIEVEEKRREAEEERRQEEERQRIMQEQEERRMREERERMRVEREKNREREQTEIFRRGSILPGSSIPKSSTSGPGEQKQFQFTSMEDLEDDDD